MARLLKVSVDAGNGFTKAVFGPDASRRFSFPSVVSVEDNRMSGFEERGIAGNHDFVIEFEDKRWAIGETVATRGLMPIKIAHRSRISTDYYRVLFAASLAASLRQSAIVEAIISLPPAAYWDREAQKEALAGRYMVKFGGTTLTYEVPYEKLHVVPEGWGTAALFCLNAKGDIRDSRFFESEVGVVDVGTYTTDLIRLSNMKIVRSGTNSLTHALRDIHQRLKTYASSCGVDIDDFQLDDALRLGYFLKSGRREGFSPQLHGWSRELALTISGQLRSDWSGGDAVETILTTGGGSAYVNPFFSQEYEHVRPVTEERNIGDVSSWESNAVGAYRYLLFLELMGGKDA